MGFSARKQWKIGLERSEAKDLARDLRVSRLLAQILLGRDIKSVCQAESFLRPRLTELIEPEKMPGVGGAVDRIREAVSRGEKIVIYGDYDVDGITGVSILWRLFKVIGGDVEYYIPHRIDEGYGLNDEAIGQICSDGAKLIITVDCGVSGGSSVSVAREMGVDVIITDHHHICEGGVPEVVSIVHPGVDGYANPDSCGAMVAFKLAWAVCKAYGCGERVSAELRSFLLCATTLAAIGTITDVVDLRGENRILTSYGLRSLRESQICGIRALIEIAELDGSDIDSYHVAFKLGPMLNAAGRMGHARLAVELLTSDNRVRCVQISEYLKDQNRQRQQLQRKISKHACEIISAKGLDHPDRRSIVLADESWHKGVVGIVASKMIERYYRPTILLHTNNGMASGSGRSVEGFNIIEAIGACSEHLVSFGGHSMAAGLTMESDRVDSFAEAFEDYARGVVSEDLFVPRLDIDGLCSIGELSDAVVRELGMLEPFGRGNVRPVLASKGVKWISRPRKVGARGDHLQVAICDGTGSVGCIGFGMGSLEKKVLESESFSVAYEPQINTFNGQSNVQLVLSDIRFD